MKMVKQMDSEEVFLNSYRVEDYERPSVATDIVALGIFSEEEDNYRKLPEQSLQILLIKRGEYPFKEQWALPGGFVRSDEMTEETARRELQEETGVKDVYMEQLYTFSEMDRDPRARVMSVAYMALMNEDQPLEATTDAKEAKWFKINYKLIDTKEWSERGMMKRESYYELELIGNKEVLTATICYEKVLKGAVLETQYKIIASSGIAFDHSKVIACAIERLRGKIEYTDVAFYLAPEYFTLTGLQKIYELVLDKALLPANFRRKIAEKVVETDEVAEGGGYRKAKLFKRKEQYF